MATTEIGLTNSRRRFDKVSYTPVQTASVGDASATMGALNQAALIRTLGVTKAELDALQSNSRETKGAAEAVGALIGALSGTQALAAAAALTAVPTAQLVDLAKRIGELRASTAKDVATTVARLRNQHATAFAQGAALAPAAGTPAAPAGVPAQVGLAATVMRAIDDTIHKSEGLMSVDHPPPDAKPAPAVARTAAARPPASDPVLWAREAQPHLLEQVRSAAGAYLPSLRSTADLDTITAKLESSVLAAELVAASLTQRSLQPIGLLHLERLVMTPVAVERGELVYSLPLAPKEKVTLAHREWTTRQEEFQQYIQDYQENFSQQGVAQSDDISMATQVQSSHSNELSMGSQPTSTTPATITPPVPASIATSTVDDATSQTASRNQSRTVTSLASARTIRDQKISFTVTTVTGVQDFTAQVFENPHDNYSLRIDYYRRMRRWRSDLYRYGVRMTYDVVLPDPGQLLRDRVDQVRQIESALSQPFQMNLAPSDLTPSTWEYYGNLYGVALTAPPEQSVRREATKVVGYDPPITTTTTPGMTWTQSHFSEELPVTLPQGYVLSAVHVDIQASTWTSGVGAQWVAVIANDFGQSFDAGNTGYVNGAVDVPIGSLPTEGTVAVAFRLKGIMTGELGVTATAVPSIATNDQWRQQAWTGLRDKAYADYLTNLDRLRQQRAALLAEISNTDALTLRRLEREQVMRATLSWLFPGFGDASSVLEALPDPGSLDTASWQKVMQFGEYIKFVQSAIDWDNVLVLLYPYFWDTLSNQQEKLLLNHPDPLHRDFLRAGAARVILAIQPGYEEDVISLLQQGQIGSLGQDTAFAKVASDVQAANAAYDATTKPSGDDSDDPRQPGVLIGSWHDYTPTAALDIDVARFPVLDGAGTNPAGP